MYTPRCYSVYTIHTMLQCIHQDFIDKLTLGFTFFNSVRAQGEILLDKCKYHIGKSIKGSSKV